MTTVNPGSPGQQRGDGQAETAVIDTGRTSGLARAYLATHQGPHGDAPAADASVTMPLDVTGRLVSPALLAAHARVGAPTVGGRHEGRRIRRRRSEWGRPGDPDRHRPERHADGHRHGAPAPARRGVHRDHEPVFCASAGTPQGRCSTCTPLRTRVRRWTASTRCGSTSSSRRRRTPRPSPRPSPCCPTSSGTRGRWHSTRQRSTPLWSASPARWTPTAAGTSRPTTAGTWPLCCAGSPTVTSSCSAISAARSRTAAPPVDLSSRLGVLRQRTDVLPQLTGDDDLLVLAQATSPSYLRYGAHPHIVVVRERPPGGTAIEHRFVGLFSVAASNANVLEIPLISRRVNEALALSHGDNSHPGQLTLDIIQTIPRSELFSLSARQLLDMANAVVDLGSRRRALLFLRTDQLSHFVSCLVYLPRDRYTTVVRLAMQDILVRELGGESIEYTARVSESPWAVVHFTVRLPDDTSPADVDTSLETETRIQDLLTEAARTWGDRLMGSVQTGAITRADAEHYSVAFPEVYRQAFTPHDAIGDIAIIEQLQDNSVKLVFADGGRGPAGQPHVVPRRPVGVPERSASHAAVHGRGRPRGTPVHRDQGRRHAGVDLPVQDLAAPLDPGGTGRRRARGDRDAVRRCGHRHLARPGRDRPVQRAGDAGRAHLAAGHDPAQLREVPAAGGISRTVSLTSRRSSTTTRTPRELWSSSSRRCSIPRIGSRSPAGSTTRRPLRSPWLRASTHSSASTPIASCGRSHR